MLVAALALAACVRADDLADKCKTVSGDGKKEYDINVLSIKCAPGDTHRANCQDAYTQNPSAPRFFFSSPLAICLQEWQ